MTALYGYQRTDAHLVDYQMYPMPGVPGGFFRGPPVSGRDYIACLGAAQTFGRFVREPFPELLSRELGIESSNLGRGGAGPSYPLRHPALMAHINAAKLVVVQVYSGRSQSNSTFRIVDDGIIGQNAITGAKMAVDEFYNWALQQEPGFAMDVVAETRKNYVRSMTELLEAITPPKILFWWSMRTPEYVERWEAPAWKLFGQFPQLVNREMVMQLQSRATAYVECVSKRGMPQQIVDREGRPSSYRVRIDDTSEQTENRYYPSPEMHEDATRVLLPVCRDLLLQA